MTHAAYLFKPLPVNEKLPSNMVSTIFQDSSGYIYFGTASGLQRYDGYDIRTYINISGDESSLPNNYVEDIQQYPGGRLLIWAGGSYSLFNPLDGKFRSDLSEEFQSLGFPGVPDIITIDGNDIWGWFDSDGIYRYSPGKGIDKVDGIPTHLARETITDLIVLPDHREAYAVTETGKLLIVNAGGMSLRACSQVPGDSGSNLIYTLFADRDKLIWIFAESGLFAFDPVAQRWINNFGGSYWPMDKPRTITQDKNGKIWVGYNQTGLAIIGKNGHIEIICNDENDSRSLPANTVTSLFEDRTGTMWIGTLKKGISLFNESIYKFDFHKFPDVNCIITSSDGNFWIGTDNKGLFLTDRNFNILKTYNNGHATDPVVCLAETADGTLYAGTYAGGITVIRNGNVSRITCKDGLASGNVWGLLQLNDGRMLIATLGGGLQVMNPSDRSFKTFNTGNSGLLSKFVGSMSKDAAGNVYLGTSAGLAIFNPDTDSISTLNVTIGHNLTPADLNINQVFVDSRGLVWIATGNGLLVYDPHNGKIYEPNPDASAAQRFILGITEDHNNSMWVSSGGNLTNIYVSVNDNVPSFSLRNYNSSDGLQHCEFNQRSFCVLPDGEILVGGLYGINSFKPESIVFNSFAPGVNFSELELFNKEVKVGEKYDGHVILPEDINSMNEIRLDHSQNEFSIIFSTDDYILPEKTTFSYILEGFNKEWTNLPEGIHRIGYTNLSPGEYTLRVRAINNDGMPSSKERILKIKIDPPFYASSFAFAAYAIFALALAILIILLIKRHEKKKYKRQAEQENLQKQEELNQLKFKFFTNISHELRTPLTLISAPLDSLIANEIDKDKRKKLCIMQANANRLLNLVNQLLDFRKVEISGLSFNPSQGNIVAFTKQICDSFLTFSEKKNINFSFSTSSDSIMMAFDEDKMGKIIMNLLSNAFKFTPDNGTVNLHLRQEAGSIVLTVSDSGNGISDEDKKLIFNRFYQASNSNSAIAGSGIGLSLVAEYVKLHNGSVSVADNSSGGTVFSVVIPIIQAHPSSQPDAISNPVDNTHEDNTPAVNPDYKDTSAVDSRRKILLVDDNTDLTDFISDELNSEYIVKTASNGKIALEKVRAFNPDIIISDIMMPEMDGIEFCRLLKSTSDTASIPLIMLTAKHDVGSKIEGLTLGADDYLTKPFNIYELKLRVRKLIELKGIGLRRTLIDPEPEKIVITPLDKQLVENAVKYVEKNIGRPELTVEEMSSELGMSRVYLYKRLKQLTGKTPIEFIRVLRLKRAAQLLRESQLNVSEIAYKCGFNNPKYFSKYFKEEFGILPSAYQDKTTKI